MTIHIYTTKSKKERREFQVFLTCEKNREDYTEIFHFDGSLLAANVFSLG